MIKQSLNSSDQLLTENEEQIFDQTKQKATPSDSEKPISQDLQFHLNLLVNQMKWQP